MSQANKSHARQGRGVGNGYNDNWRNSPLWDNIGPRSKQDDNPETEEVKVEAVDLEDLELKERMKRLQSMAY